MEEVKPEAEMKEIDKVNLDYGIECARLGDLIIRDEINTRKIEETKTQLHKLQARAQKLHTKAQLEVVPTPTEEVPNGPA